ncbi:MAG: hypothetical protein ACYTER_01200, partial [Planctomycetota bacterium]
LSIATGGTALPYKWASVQKAIQYFLDQKQIPWTLAFEHTVLFGPSEIGNSYSVDGKWAKFVLIDPSGKIAEIIPEAESLLEKVSEHLEPQL